jgi:hypothetical protein
MKVRACLIAALALAAGACSNEKKQEGKEPPVAPQPEPVAGSGSATEAPKPDPKVERGEYLAAMLGCPYCHMPMGPQGPDFTRPFAGGAEIPEKFGTWRSPNITQDKETGIGNWTDDQIAAAIRQGTRPDGEQLFPIMPYLNYNRMTDDDTKAIVAYLRTVKPVVNKVERAKDLKLPKIKAPPPSNAPDPVGDPVKHGEYLVTLMHCDMCHTPMGPTGPDRSKLYAGGFEMEMPPLGTGKLIGPNITSDPETGIGKWSAADVEKSIKYLTRPDGTVIQGPMQFYLAGWSKMKDEDLQAVAAFVKQIPPIKNKVPKGNFKPHGAPGAPPPGAGSAAAGSAAKPGTGSAAPATGSAAPAMKPATGSAAAKPATGSAAPAAKPAAGSAAPAAAPAAGSGSSN